MSAVDSKKSATGGTFCRQSNARPSWQCCSQFNWPSLVDSAVHAGKRHAVAFSYVAPRDACVISQYDLSVTRLQVLRYPATVGRIVVPKNVNTFYRHIVRISRRQRPGFECRKQLPFCAHRDVGVMTTVSTPVMHAFPSDVETSAMAPVFCFGFSKFDHQASAGFGFPGSKIRTRHDAASSALTDTVPKCPAPHSVSCFCFHSPSGKCFPAKVY